jgi:hypothetical protein
MAAYEDGMSKLLWRERRQGLGSIKVTTQDSKLPDLCPLLKQLDPKLAAFDFDPDLLRGPKGTPIGLHLSLGKNTPFGRTVQRSDVTVAIPILSGLQHHYVRI